MTQLYGEKNSMLSAFVAADSVATIIFKSNFSSDYLNNQRGFQAVVTAGM